MAGEFECIENKEYVRETAIVEKELDRDNLVEELKRMEEEIKGNEEVHMVRFKKDYRNEVIEIEVYNKEKEMIKRIKIKNKSIGLLTGIVNDYLISQIRRYTSKKAIEIIEQYAKKYFKEFDQKNLELYLSDSDDNTNYFIYRLESRGIYLKLVYEIFVKLSKDYDEFICIIANEDDIRIFPIS